jgi:hypothetical protein
MFQRLGLCDGCARVRLVCFGLGPGTDPMAGIARELRVAIQYFRASIYIAH